MTETPPARETVTVLFDGVAYSVAPSLQAQQRAEALALARDPIGALHALLGPITFTQYARHHDVRDMSTAIRFLAALLEAADLHNRADAIAREATPPDISL